ncbi:hypothetical protein BpHYR1_044808 [Brachionus plicatilis]|uniref:Uncharacterized protein n=1 Tax=Brachionus plicatilis TaxID=10195 RepID=A0A3M7QHZ9_BRAPC|nr:hypothetical protein BpHYR1_044808 [Brachionus plicatilis]
MRKKYHCIQFQLKFLLTPIFSNNYCGFNIVRSPNKNRHLNFQFRFDLPSQVQKQRLEFIKKISKLNFYIMIYIYRSSLSLLNLNETILKFGVSLNKAIKLGLKTRHEYSFI